MKYDSIHDPAGYVFAYRVATRGQKRTARTYILLSNETARPLTPLEGACSRSPHLL